MFQRLDQFHTSSIFSSVFCKQLCASWCHFNDPCSYCYYPFFSDPYQYALPFGSFWCSCPIFTVWTCMCDQVFVNDQFLNWDPENRIKVRIISARAYHSLFMHNMWVEINLKLPLRKTLLQNCWVCPSQTVLESLNWHRYCSWICEVAGCAKGSECFWWKPGRKGEMYIGPVMEGPL